MGEILSQTKILHGPLSDLQRKLTINSLWQPRGLEWGTPRKGMLEGEGLWSELMEAVASKTTGMLKWHLRGHPVSFWVCALDFGLPGAKGTNTVWVSTLKKNKRTRKKERREEKKRKTHRQTDNFSLQCPGSQVESLYRILKMSSFSWMGTVNQLPVFLP